MQCVDVRSVSQEENICENTKPATWCVCVCVSIEGVSVLVARADYSEVNTWNFYTK